MTVEIWYPQKGTHRGNFKSYRRRDFIKTLGGGVALLFSYNPLMALERQRSLYRNFSSHDILASSIQREEKYPETIAILQNLYREEILTCLAYSAYAPKAMSENYPNIAHLFSAFMVSESIHAHNFKTLLSDFGVEVEVFSKPEIKASSTKKNLKHATMMELRHIDQVYPNSIEKMSPENHKPTIWNATNAWEGEKQHRDLINKIKSCTGMLFSLLAKFIEKTPSQFFVCQTCGSTVRELPKEICVICKKPVSYHKKIETIR
jgi:rubrerythrin